IGSHRDGDRVSEAQVSVDATVTDQGGGIGKIEWRVNGVTLGVDARGLKRTDAPPPGSEPALKLRQTLTLEAGDNLIEVVAYNAEGLIASLPVSVTVVHEDAAPTASAVRLHVLAVGINDYYDGRLRLNYAVPDARAVAEAFKRAGAGLYESVDVVTV